jgi:hypothetical protein
MPDVRLLVGGSLQLDGMPIELKATVDVHGEATPAPARDCAAWPPSAVPLFFDPRRARSLSRAPATPILVAQDIQDRLPTAQRSKRRNWLLELQSHSGRSSRGAGATNQSTASRDRRSSRATPPCWPRCPGKWCLIRSHSAHPAWPIQISHLVSIEPMAVRQDRWGWPVRSGGASSATA